METLHIDAIKDCIGRVRKIRGLSGEEKDLIESIMGKDIPMKPRELQKLFPGGQYSCARCGCAVTQVQDRPAGMFATVTEIRKIRRCHGCGQLIDWDEKIKVLV